MQWIRDPAAGETEVRRCVLQLNQMRSGSYSSYASVASLTNMWRDTIRVCTARVQGHGLVRSGRTAQGCERSRVATAGTGAGCAWRGLQPPRERVQTARSRCWRCCCSRHGDQGTHCPCTGTRARSERTNGASSAKQHPRDGGCDAQGCAGRGTG